VTDTPEGRADVEEEPVVADDAAPAADDAEPEVTVEDIVNDLERLVAERDELLSLAQRTQADFENYRKRTMKQQAEEVARASGRIVEALLPVLDAFDYAAAHGEESLKPMRDQLVTALEKAGLTRVESDGAPFDPSVHEAVAHEPADEPGSEPVVSETMRAGYLWQGSLLRAAMVKVKG
jgi:molecular chaperone GrpE